MPKVLPERKIITDKLSVEKTGRTLEEWFLELDKRGAGKLEHNKIFDLVSRIDGLKPLGEWNQNLLTTTYEWSRGIKLRGEKKNGFEISVSKTIEVPIDILYNSWVDDNMRKKWLKEKIVFRKSTLNKSARITWSDDTSLSVDFYSKGKDKSQVVVQHQKIKTFEESEDLKIFWTKKLDAFKKLLEKN